MNREKMDDTVVGSVMLICTVTSSLRSKKPNVVTH